MHGGIESQWQHQKSATRGSRRVTRVQGGELSIGQLKNMYIMIEAGNRVECDDSERLLCFNKPIYVMMYLLGIRIKDMQANTLICNLCQL